MGRKLDSHVNSHVGGPATTVSPASGLHAPRWERSGRSGLRRRQRRVSDRRVIVLASSPAGTLEVQMKKSTDEQPEAPKSYQTDPAKVKAGHVMAITHFVRVELVVPCIASHPDQGVAEINVRNLGAGPSSFLVQGGDLIRSMASADLFEAEERVTKTRAAELLVTAYNRPFTVCFSKRDGSEHVLRGRLVQPEPLLGRSMCEDLDIDLEESAAPVGKRPSRLRLVDHRTIKWLVLDGVRYNVAK